MTQTAAIAKALLNGEVLSIMNGFKLFSCTNLPRELSRSIEKKFGVTISKDKVVFKSKYGQPGFYYRYRLNRTEANELGIQKMFEYVEANAPKEKVSKPEPKKEIHTNQLF